MIDNRLALLPAQSVAGVSNAINNGFNTFFQTQQNARRNQLLDLQESSQAHNQGRQNALLDITQQQNERAGEQHDLQMKAAQGAELYNMAKVLRSLPQEQRTWQLNHYIPKLKEYGFTDEELATGMDDDAELDQAISFFSQYATKAKDAATRDFEAKAKAAGLEPGSPEYKHAAAVALGIQERAGTRSSQERIASSQELTRQVAESEATIAGAEATAKEAGKLEAQKELRPEVEAAVAQAVEQAKDTAERTDKAQSNETALNVYDQAMSGLVGSLSGTQTGPGMGWISLTASQQIADGAVAAMAPVLKQLFRSAGEGNFTDRDQQMLLDMVPTRKDHPEAIRAKIENIDAIVRAKLGGGKTPEKPQANDGSFTSSSGISFTVE